MRADSRTPRSAVRRARSVAYFRLCCLGLVLFSCVSEEYLSRQLVLCQCLMALVNLREGGVFVCKLFDSFLPFTVELLWIVRKCFSHFALIKPNQSRPANSERYVVAHGFLQRRPAVVEYLFDINQRINELRKGYKLDAMTAVDFNANRDRANRERDRNIREAAATATAAAAAAALKFQPSSDGPLNAEASAMAFEAEAGVKMEDEPGAAADGEAAAAAVKTEPVASVKSEAPDSGAEVADAAAAAAAAVLPPVSSTVSRRCPLPVACRCRCDSAAGASARRVRALSAARRRMPRRVRV